MLLQHVKVCNYRIYRHKARNSCPWQQCRVQVIQVRIRHHKLQIVSRQGSTTHWGKLYIHNNSSTRKHLLRPIPELYGVQTSAEITVFNLRTNYKMSLESHKRCNITRTNYAVFTINRSKKINSRFTELRFLSNSNVMSLVGLGANKWGGIETTLLEAVDRKIRKTSKRLGFIVD